MIDEGSVWRLFSFGRILGFAGSLASHKLPDLISNLIGYACYFRVTLLHIGAGSAILRSHRGEQMRREAAAYGGCGWSVLVACVMRRVGVSPVARGPATVGVRVDPSGANEALQLTVSSEVGRS